MKILFLVTAACLVFSISSSAQTGGRKFSDQYCVPYCERYCEQRLRDRPAGPDGDTNPVTRRKNCNLKCVPMCRELGH
jgi:hypothetical protein